MTVIVFSGLMWLLIDNNDFIKIEQVFVVPRYQIHSCAGERVEVSADAARRFKSC